MERNGSKKSNSNESELNKESTNKLKSNKHQQNVSSVTPEDDKSDCINPNKSPSINTNTDIETKQMQEVHPNEAKLKHQKQSVKIKHKRKRDEVDAEPYKSKPKTLKIDKDLPVNQPNDNDDDDASSDDSLSDISDCCNEDENVVLKHVEFEHTSSDLYANVLEQVCLEGLDGITIEAFWKRLNNSMEYRLILTNKLKEKIWWFILNCDRFKFFELAAPRPSLIIFDRYQYLDPDLGMVIEPDKYPDSIYLHKCINDKSANIIGSCPEYYTRKDVTEEAKSLSLLEADKQYGLKLVIVADQYLRSNCLFKDLMDPNLELTEMQYCILERIGRSRKFGEITQGKLSLQEICKDSRMMFYNRKILKKQHLINKQLFYLKTSTIHHSTGSLLHLQRFYNQKKLKMQIITEKIVEALRLIPFNRMEYTHLKKRFGPTRSIKKLLKTSDFQRFVQTDVLFTYRDLYPDATRQEWKIKGREKERQIRTVNLINPSINVSAAWHEDCNEDEESPDEENFGSVCMHWPLLNQTYDIIFQTATEGISIRKLQKILGIDYYTVRATLTTLISRDLIDTFKIDKKRQKVVRYYAKCFNDVRTQSVSQKNTENYDIDITRKSSKIKALHVFKKTIKGTENVAKVNTDVISLKELNAENSLVSIDKRVDEVINFIGNTKIHNKITPFSLNVKFENQNRSAETAWFSSWQINENLNITIKTGNIDYVVVVQKENVKTKTIKYTGLKCEKLSIPKLLLIQALQEGFDNIKEKLLTDCSGQNLKVQICHTKTNRKKKFEEPNLPFGNSTEDLNYLLGPNPVVAKEMHIEDNIELKILVSTTPDHYKPFGTSFEQMHKNQTQRFVKRANIIMNVINEEEVVTDTSKFGKIIYEMEKNENYDAHVDRRSIRRIFEALLEGGYIRVVKIIIKSDKIMRIKNIICKPNISVDHTEINSAIEQLKMKCFSTAKHKTEKKTYSSAGKKATTSNLKSLSRVGGNLKKTSSNKGVTKLVYNRLIGKTYGYSPKFVRMKTLHKFLYYLVYGSRSNTEIDISEVMTMYENHDITLSTEELKEYSTVYCAEIDWKMFVPPIPSHKNWPDGWVLISDILIRLPLSILVKLFNVTYVVPNLNAYLNHPVKKHTLVTNLPVGIRSILLHRRKYVYAIYETLVRLNTIGLLQFGPQKYKEKDQTFIFLNRNALLYDTTTSELGYRTISNQTYEKIRFNFTSSHELENYWQRMLYICLRTKLGNISYIPKEKCFIPKEITVKESKNFEDAMLLDIGHIPGDNKGAAGLDSSLWSHIKRNWMWRKRADEKPKPPVEPSQLPPSSQTQSLPNVRKRKIDKVNYKPIKFDEIKAQQSKKPQSVLKTYLSPKSKKRRLKEKVMIEEKKLKEREKVVKVKREHHDLIDRKIMSRIARSRVMWSKQEDHVLMLCKIVSKFLAPSAHKQIIPYIVIRDLLHKLCPKISSNKTSKACVRRIAWLSKMSKKKGQNLKEKLDFLITIPHVRSYYKNYKETIQNESAQKDKATANAFMYLVNYLFKEDLNKLYKKNKRRDIIRDKLVNKNLIKYYKPDWNLSIYCDAKNKSDILLDVIKGVIHSFLGNTESGTNITQQLLSLNQLFSDDMLRTALQVLRKQHVLVKNQTFSKSNSTSRPFRFSFNYIFGQITKFPMACYAQSYDFIIKLREYTETNENPSFQVIFDVVKPFEQGHNIGLNELITVKSMDIHIDLPEEVLILNPSIEDHSEVIKELALRYKYIISKKHRAKKMSTAKVVEIQEDDKKTDGDNIINKKHDNTPVTIKDIVQKVLKAYDSNNEQEREELERSLKLDLHVISDSTVEEQVHTSEENSSDNKYSQYNHESELLYSSESEDEAEISEPSVNDIMTGMMENIPEESRTIPHITDLTCLLTQGLIPELDKDVAWLEKLREHFVMICPTSKMLVDRSIVEEETVVSIFKNHDERCSKLHHKLETDFAIKDVDVIDFSVVKTKLSNDADFVNAKNFIDFIEKHEDFGVTTKEIKEKFDQTLGNVSLKNILEVLLEMRIVLRFGITCFRFVHSKFKNAWLVNKCIVDGRENSQIDVDKTEYVRIMPWSHINGSLNMRVLLVWMCVILTRCLNSSCTPFKGLVMKYYYLKPIDIFYILECLETLGCVELITCKEQKVSLFTSSIQSDVITEEKATCLSNLDEMIVKSHWMAMTLFGSFINEPFEDVETAWKMLLNAVIRSFVKQNNILCACV